MGKIIKKAKDIKIIASEDDIYLENGDGIYILETTTYIIASYEFSSEILTLIQYFKREDKSLENIYWIDVHTTNSYAHAYDFDKAFEYICNVAQRMIPLFEDNVKKHFERMMIRKIYIG